MLDMGWKKDAVCQWKTVFAQPILDDANGHLDDTYGHIKTAIGSVLEGRSYSDEEVKEMIAPVPDKQLQKGVYHVLLGCGMLRKKTRTRVLAALLKISAYARVRLHRFCSGGQRTSCSCMRGVVWMGRLKQWLTNGTQC